MAPNSDQHSRGRWSVKETAAPEDEMLLKAPNDISITSVSAKRAGVNACALK